MGWGSPTSFEPAAATVAAAAGAAAAASVVAPVAGVAAATAAVGRNAGGGISLLLLLLLLLVAVAAAAVVATGGGAAAAPTAVANCTGIGRTVAAAFAVLGAAASYETPHIYTTAVLGPSGNSPGERWRCIQFPPAESTEHHPRPSRRDEKCMPRGGRQATGACIYCF